MVCLLGFQRQYVTFDDRTLKQLVSNLKYHLSMESFLGNNSPWISLQASKAPTALCPGLSLKRFLFSKQCWNIMSPSYICLIITLLLFITFWEYTYVIVLCTNYIVRIIQILIDIFAYLIYQLLRQEY